MYQIYLDGNLVWTNETTEVGLYSAKISLKDNSTQTLDISVAAANDPFKSAAMLKSVVDVYEYGQSEPIFEGRAVNHKVDFYGNASYQFEGVLGYLYDSIQPPAVYTGQTIQAIFTALINEHNSQVESFKQFQVGNCTVEDIYTDSSTYSGQGRLKDDDPTEEPWYKYQKDSNATGIDQTELTTGYESTFEAMNNLLINNLHGHLIVRFQNGVKYLDYLKDYLPSEGQTILFGSNMLDYSGSWDYSKMCTGVLPLGYSRGTDDFDKDDPDNPEHPDNKYQEQEDPLQTIKNKLTIASVNGGSKILWSEQAVANYGKIVKKVEWSNIKDAQKLYDKAKKYLLSTQFDNMSLDCKVVDLHFIDPSIGPLHHMHMVRVKSYPHGLDKSMPISEMDIDLLNPANDSVTLGATYNSISGALAGTSNNLSSVTGAIGDVNTTISNNNTTYWTNITKTDQAITLEASSREKAINDEVINRNAAIKVAADGITSDVNEYKTKTDKTLEEHSSSIKQNADSISTEVTNRTTAVDGVAKTVSSHWKQTATSFSLGFNSDDTLSLTYNTGDGTSKTTSGVDIKVKANNVDWNVTGTYSISASHIDFSSGGPASFTTGRLDVNDTTNSATIQNGIVSSTNGMQSTTFIAMQDPRHGEYGQTMSLYGPDMTVNGTATMYGNVYLKRIPKAGTDIASSLSFVRIDPNTGELYYTTNTQGL